MKYIPILFSTAMVQALLAGRKTMTRRVVKPQPLNGLSKWINNVTNEVTVAFATEKTLNHTMNCPYGKVGDVLWVREGFNQRQDEIAYKASPELFKKTRWYKEIQSAYKVTSLEMPEGLMPKMKPSIHMPKTACRIFLKIQSIRVERLKDITDADALAEGIQEFTKDGKTVRYGLDGWNWSYTTPATGPTMDDKPWRAFAQLWGKINGNWNDNPWVWVIEFERIEKPANFLTP